MKLKLNDYKVEFKIKTVEEKIKGFEGQWI